ncbi:putative short chain type dehydrogenase [Plectosphaerella plurivora]|uniref:Short chain type dehydrogenase n=1 Tax=Plectosphaerella plurivora TaxID=936078 RepID=A0A9P8VHR6_9PEZI|nr:putative short chain type dehydrogenase [Plectosphaerella plurivora]
METCSSHPDLSGKVALIMGIGQTAVKQSTSWGNGAAIAYALSKNNVTIFGCDIDISAAKHTQSRLPGPCEVMAADVTSEGNVKAAVDACLAHHGRIDILVNNVGYPVRGDATTLSGEVWDEQIRVNFTSVYLSCHLVLPIMEKQGSGVIINNASIAGLRSLGKPQIAYNSAKAAVIHFTKVTAAEYAHKGVRLNCVAPGIILTPLIESWEHSQNEGQVQLHKKIMSSNIPMGRLGDAFDVANAVTFLSSDTAKYITGQTLVVDGGLTLTTCV